MRRITKLSTGPPLTVGSAGMRLGPRSLHLHFIVKYCTKLERVICNLTFLIFFYIDICVIIGIDFISQIQSLAI